MTTLERKYMAKKREITGCIQIKRGKWWVVINLYDSDNNRKPKWIKTDLPEKGNKRRAEKLLADYLSEYNKLNIPYTSITVAQYFTKWLDEIKEEVRVNTYRSYYGNMVNHIIPYFERQGILLQELTPLDLEEYYKSKQRQNSKVKTNDPLSPTTIKHHHQNISKALSDAVRKGMIMTNPATAARTPKAERHKTEYLNPNQIKELQNIFKGTVIELPVYISSLYGFRRSEVLGLKWSNIDFVNRSITIAETLQQGVGGDYTDDTKTDSSYRTLPMTDDVYNILLKAKKLQGEMRLLLGDGYTVSDYVCTWKNGKVITPNYLSRTFHAIIGKSGLPVIRFHDLRHSAASNLLDMGFSVVQVAEWLGHSSSATTLNFYAHAEKRSKMNIADALQNQFQNASDRQV